MNGTLNGSRVNSIAVNAAKRDSIGPPIYSVYPDPRRTTWKIAAGRPDPKQSSTTITGAND